MTKRCLITGIGGSIGCHVLAHLMHHTDWHIVGVDSFRHKGLYDRITETMFHHPPWDGRLDMVTHDLRGPFSEMTRKRIGPLDYIVNLASLPDVYDSIQDPVPFIMSNTAIMLNTLELGLTNDLTAFVHVSTDEVYGQTDGHTYHKEWAPSLPSSPYSASKVSQEAAAIAYWRTYRLPLVIVNLMNNFGEMQSPAKFPSIVIRKVMRGEVVTIHGSETAVGTRHYIHSRNAADAMLFMMRRQPTMHADGSMDVPDRYNVVGGPAITNLDMAQQIADILGKPLRYQFEPFNKTRPGHDWHYGLDGQKLHDLGWRPPVTFEQSLRDTVEWYKTHPEWLDPR
jgi:dTDP-D-glucose 4,6-dehydratase